jgi:hypothetical protein
VAIPAFYVWHFCSAEQGIEERADRAPFTERERELIVKRRRREDRNNLSLQG